MSEINHIEYEAAVDGIVALAETDNHPLVQAHAKFIVGIYAFHKDCQARLAAGEELTDEDFATIGKIRETLRKFSAHFKRQKELNDAEEAKQKVAA